MDIKPARMPGLLTTSARPGASPTPLASVIAWLGMVFGVIYLTFLGGGAFFGIYLWLWRDVSISAIAVALGTWLIMAIRRAAWRPRTVLWPAFLVSLAAFAICTVTSWAPRLSLEYVAYAVICTSLYLLLVRLLAHPWFQPRIGGLAVLLCLAMGFEYVVFCLAHWISWWSALGRLAVPPLRPQFEGLSYGNPSAVATMMLLLCPAAIAYLGTSGVSRRFLVALLLALTAAVALLTGSRGAWLGAFVGCGALTVGLLFAADTRAAVIRAATSRTGKWAIAGIAVTCVMIAAILAPTLMARALQSDGGYRLSFFLAAIEMFASSPLVGSGPGTWVARRLAFTNGATGADLYIPHAHDIYLQTLAEFGVLGLVAGIVVVAALAWLVFQAIISHDAVRRRYGWASLFALAYLGGHQLVDFYPNFPAVMFALALSVGFLDATSGPSPVDRWVASCAAASRALSRVAAPALVIALVAALGFTSWSESVALGEAQAVAQVNAGKTSEALLQAESAVAADPAMTPYQFTLGVAAADAGDLQTAEGAFQTVATRDDFPEAWLDLAAVYLRLGNPSGARSALRQAMRVGWQQSLVSVAAGDLYMRLGDANDAALAIAHAYVLAPELAADPYWSSRRRLRMAADRAVAEAVATSPKDVAYRVLMAAGRTVEAESVAAQLSVGSTPALLYVRAWNGDRSALSQLAAYALAHPYDSAVNLAGLAAERLGDQALANRMDGIASQQGVGVTRARLLLTIAQTCGPCPQPPGADAQLYGFYTYRRPIPADLLVLDLPRLAYR